MTTLHLSLDDRATMAVALTPVREALLARARADVDGVLASADADAASQVAVAEQQAADAVAEARAQGVVDGEAALAVERARGRREARAVVLRAQSEVYDELREQCHEAMRELCAGPAYPPLREALLSQVQRELGPEATVTDAPAGGLVAEVSGRRLDFSADALADRAITALGGQVERLWAP